MFVAWRQRDQLRRHGACGGPLAQCLQAQGRLFAQFGQHGRGGVGDVLGRVAERTQGAHLAAQQVAVDELGELEVGVVAHQRLRLGQGLSALALADQAVDADQPRLGVELGFGFAYRAQAWPAGVAWPAACRGGVGPVG